jgi:hypothetical protein
MARGSADVTTIKVSKRLRDRITAGATQQHQPVQGFLERVLDDYDRHQRLAAVAAAMNSAEEGTLRAWRTESDSWAALDSDIDGAQ